MDRTIGADTRTRLRPATLAATLVILAGAAGAVLGGVGLIAPAPSTAAAQPAPGTPVGAIAVALLPGYVVTRRFTGQIEARAQADLGFELDGRIAEIRVDEGDRVARGDVLAALDTSALSPERAALEAELAALAADAELGRLTLSRNDALTGRGFQSVAAQDAARLGLARTEARMAAVRAQIAGVDVRLEKSLLRAPFDARVGRRLADPGQTAAAGQPALVLFASAPPQLRVGLPPDLAAALTPGDTAAVEIGGAPVEAAVLAIRPDLDPATRGRAVLLALPAQADLALGDTATLILTQRIADPGFWAPLSALREGARGSWSVMAIEASPDGDRVRPAAVEALHTDGTRVFLRGLLPQGARIIGQAPDRVAPGQRVVAQAE